MVEAHTPKQSTPTRTPTLLPQNNQTIRPNQGSSVSTQTANQNQVLVGQKNAKLRTKPANVRPAVTNLKTDAGNQTKLLQGSQLQQVITSAGNKMVVTMSNNGTQMFQQMIPKQPQTTFLQVSHELIKLKSIEISCSDKMSIYFNCSNFNV